LFKSDYAHSLFYERQPASLYPVEYPHNFKSFYATYYAIDQQGAINKCNSYLDFVGIKVTGEKIRELTKKSSAEFQNFINKAYYIVKTLAHYNPQLISEDNPYKDIFREI